MCVFSMCMGICTYGYWVSNDIYVKSTRRKIKIACASIFIILSFIVCFCITKHNDKLIDDAIECYIIGAYELKETRVNDVVIKRHYKLIPEIDYD